MTEHNLTGVLAEIEAACGLAAALKLARDFGGTEIYVPTHLVADHKLARALGPYAARALAAAFGGGPLEVPLGPTATVSLSAAAIRRHLDAGRLTTPQIARLVGCTMRTVRHHRNRRPKDDGQAELF